MGGAGIKGENATEYAEAQAGGPGANGGEYVSRGPAQFQ
jgi:hypothetical protein